MLVLLAFLKPGSNEAPGPGSAAAWAGGYLQGGSELGSCNPQAAPAECQISALPTRSGSSFSFRSAVIKKASFFRQLSKAKLRPPSLAYRDDRLPSYVRGSIWGNQHCKQSNPYEAGRRQPFHSVDSSRGSRL